MTRKISPEDRVLDFFMTAPLDVAGVTFNMVKRVLFNRQYGPPAEPKPKRKVQIEAAKATELVK